MADSIPSQLRVVADILCRNVTSLHDVSRAEERAYYVVDLELDSPAREMVGTAFASHCVGIRRAVALTLRLEAAFQEQAEIVSVFTHAHPLEDGPIAAIVRSHWGKP